MYLETVPWDALKHSRLQEFVNVSLDLLFHVTWTIPAANAITSTVTWQWLCCWQVHILSNFMRYTGLHRLLHHQIHQHTPYTKVSKEWWSRASCPQMSVDILLIWGKLWPAPLSMVQCCFMSAETVRHIRTESPGQPPGLSHCSRTQISKEAFKCFMHPTLWVVLVFCFRKV